jgi:hypothetical protein
MLQQLSRDLEFRQSSSSQPSLHIRGAYVKIFTMASDCLT